MVRQWDRIWIRSYTHKRGPIPIMGCLLWGFCNIGTHIHTYFDVKSVRPGGCFKNLYELINLRALKFSVLNKNRIFVNVRILIEISLNFVPKGTINNIPALVQIRAWRRPGAKPLSEPMMVCLPTHICVTRPQGVKCRGKIFCVEFHSFPFK